MTNLQSNVCALAAVILAAAPAGAQTVLITGMEAMPPISPGQQGATLRSFHMRGIEPLAPQVALLSPASGQPLHAGRAFELKLGFTPPPGMAIEVASVRLLYLHGTVIDITQRLGPHIAADGIDVTDAVAPAGRHVLRLEVRDTRGDLTRVDFELNVLD